MYRGHSTTSGPRRTGSRSSFRTARSRSSCIRSSRRTSTCARPASTSGTTPVISGGTRWYSKNFWHLPFPRQPLTTSSCRTVCATRRSNRSRSTPSVSTAPTARTSTSTWSGKGSCRANYSSTKNHMDQPGRIKGTLVLHGETIDVDGVGFRDRTWSRRIQFGQGIGALRLHGLHLGHIARLR